MTYLTSAELASMRGAYSGMLPDSIDILERTATNSGGGVSYDWNPVVTDVPARVAMPAGGEEAGGGSGREVDEERQVFFVGADVNVSEEQRILWDGREFEVNAVHRRGNWEISRQVIATEVP